MKKIWLLCLAALLLMQGVCLAKIQKQVDKFDGSYCYYVDTIYFPGYADSHVITSFTLFPDAENGDEKYLQISLYSRTAYAIEPTIKIRIDDTIYTWTSNGSSSRGNSTVDFTFLIPDNVYDALMKTEKNVAVRFFYKDITGDYKEEFAISYKKTIKDVQAMYKTYRTPTKQPAN